MGPDEGEEMELAGKAAWLVFACLLVGAGGVDVGGGLGGMGKEGV